MQGQDIVSTHRKLLSRIFNSIQGHVLIAIMALLVLPSFCLAVDRTAIWVGGTDSNWSTAANWNEGLIPINIDTIFFNVTIPSGFTVNFDVTTGTGQIKTLTLGNSTLNILPGTTGLTVVSQADIDGLINSTGGNFTATGLGTTFSGNKARVFASGGGQVTIGAP
ncbi:MAG: hypothetical protein O7G85_11800, partial [Planctomycetota bacterium]|nr:hypothetical protein [Planctomycetota bacterium]